MKKTIFLIFASVLTAGLFAQGAGQNRTFEETIHTIAYTNSKELVGIDVTAHVSVKYIIENDVPKAFASVQMEKGNTIYFNGKQYMRGEVGEEAYNAIDTRNATLTFDLFYDGRVIKTIIYPGLTSELRDLKKSGYWTIFESLIPTDGTVDPELAKEILYSTDWKLVNMQLSEVRSVNYHLVEVYINSQK